MIRLFGKDSPAKLTKKFTLRPPLTGLAVPPSWKIVDRYPLNAPFSYAVIAEEPSTSTKKYFQDEVPLSAKEAVIYSSLLETLESEVAVPRSQVNPREYFTNEARRIVSRYKIRASQVSWPKMLYFAERDLAGFGILDGLMRDPYIEDISADGVGKSFFVYQRDYESLETNIVLKQEWEFDNLITRLSHMARKHISTAFPIVQGTLPGRHRLMATYRREVSPYGGTLTIRKFREDPITVIDMLNLNVINQRLAAYVWLLMENRATAVIVGATGAGKTTMLNALLTLTRMNTKVVTIEEVQEINIAHSNWVALVTRENYGKVGEGTSDVSLFDLVKAAMRMRPDILVVGEVRGEEAYVLFQAISTGHGGLCTLHADDAVSAIQRLTSKPMDVPPSFIPFVDLIITVRRMVIRGPRGGLMTVRRVLSVDEVISVGNYVRTFKWDLKTDSHIDSFVGDSAKLSRLAKDTGVSLEDLAREINRRSTVLKWIQQRGIRNFREVSLVFEEYRSKGEETYERAVKELGTEAETGEEIEEDVRQ